MKYFVKKIIILLFFLSGNRRNRRYSSISGPDKISNFECFLSYFFKRYGDRKFYENGILQMYQKISMKGTMTIIGGGLGVTAVCAVKMGVNPNSLTIYDGSGHSITQIKSTLFANELKIPKNNIKHLIIEKDISVYAGCKAVDTLPASKIKYCDILQIDAEGSEIDILKNLKINPKYIVVETHGFLGAPSKKVKSLLISMNYKIIHENFAEPNSFCLNNDIKVLLAKLGNEE
jgi:hypothetical protein